MSSLGTPAHYQKYSENNQRTYNLFSKPIQHLTPYHSFNSLFSSLRLFVLCRVRHNGPRMSCWAGFPLSLRRKAPCFTTEPSFCAAISLVSSIRWLGGLEITQDQLAIRSRFASYAAQYHPYRTDCSPKHQGSRCSPHSCEPNKERTHFETIFDWRKPCVPLSPAP